MRGWRTVIMLALCAAGALATAGCAARRDTSLSHSPSGTLQRDAEGRAYQVRKISKSQAVRVDAGRVRTNWGIALDVVGEDAATYHYKLYEVQETKPAASP